MNTQSVTPSMRSDLNMITPNHHELYRIVLRSAINQRLITLNDKFYLRRYKNYFMRAYNRVFYYFIYFQVACVHIRDKRFSVQICILCVYGAMTPSLAVF